MKDLSKVTWIEKRSVGGYRGLGDYDVAIKYCYEKGSKTPNGTRITFSNNVSSNQFKQAKCVMVGYDKEHMYFKFYSTLERNTYSLLRADVGKKPFIKIKKTEEVKNFIGGHDLFIDETTKGEVIYYINSNKE